MKSAALVPVFTLAVLLTQIILSRLSDSLLALSDSAHTLSLLLTLCPPLILSRSPSSLSRYSRQRLPSLFSFLSPLLLTSLSLSLALGSLGRLIRPHPPNRPAIVIAGGLLGLAFNLLYISLAGAQLQCPSRNRTSSEGATTNPPLADGPRDEDKSYELPKNLPRWRPLVFLVPSTVLLASGLALLLISDSRALHYTDPALCLVVVLVMVASAYFTLVQNARLLLQAVPVYCSLPSLKQGLEGLCGPGGHHELHVWEVAPGQAVASIHLHCPEPEDYQKLLDQTLLLFGRHGIREVTVQPEFGTRGACQVACGPACLHHLCCEAHDSGTSGTKDLVLTNIGGETVELETRECVPRLKNPH